ncbi:MAG: ATP-binding protein, partial [Proteobacteria bacterium]|nr:ATP-binding protein [Pseudomonadota bacterium]
MSALWEEFVGFAIDDTAHLVDQLGDAEAARSLDHDTLAGLAHRCFRLGMASLLMGADEVGKLVLAAERVLEVVAADDLEAWPVIAASVATLRGAIAQLANPDKSGARVEGLPLGQRREALEAIAARHAEATPRRTLAGPMSAALAPTSAATSTGPLGFVWTPTVDEDMIDLFFDEANERVEALAGKLIEIERAPGGDAKSEQGDEMLRDVFRDLHTVKGSSAMVGLQPVNQLAHAAEDLVGQIRDAGRAVDEPVIDALLAALDGLREMLAMARARQPITFDPTPIVMRLRNPGTPIAHKHQAATAFATPAAAAAQSEAKQTIRVDFDKLDRLLNLVGELVLGRDDLRNSVTALASVTSELAADRGVARRVVHARGAAGGALARGLETLGDEIGRIERVLDDVTTDLDHGTDRLDAISAELRDQVMRLRMVPVGGVFRKHVRTVRDLAASLQKRARLEVDGDETELDKLLVESLDEPLMHLVRNAVDHGIEMPDVRLAAGKPAEGVIRLEAAHRGNQVEIRVADDGKGLDPARLKARAVERGLIAQLEADGMDDRAAWELIFRPGFSTAATVSEISGRGVGMDVVRQTIVNRLKGTIEIESRLGQGSALVLKLPLTLAIIQVLVARVAGET